MAEFREQKVKRHLRMMRAVQVVMWVLVALALYGLLHSYKII